MSISLWLVPKDDNPSTKVLQELISDTIPRNFVATDKIQSFPPHVTITSGLSLTDTSPQAWLDNLQLSDFNAQKNEVILELDTLVAEDAFYRKMNLTLTENANLRQLCTIARSAAGQDVGFAKSEFRPHLSLFYGDTPTVDVKAKIPLVEMKIGFALGDLFACCGGSLCMGGKLVLVDTGRPVGEWSDAVLASREAAWATWRGSRSLL